MFDPLFAKPRKQAVKASNEVVANDVINCNIKADDGRIIPVQVNTKERLVFPTR